MRIANRQASTGSGGVLASITVVIGCLIGLVGTAARADEATIPPEFAGKSMPAGMRDDAKARAMGKDMYEGKVNPEINCARCHGNDGKPTKLGKGAPDLSSPSEVNIHSDTHWFWRISEKKPGTTMPGYKDKLTEEQRWQVIAYLRTLAQSGK